MLETVRESLKTVTSFEDFRAVVKAFLLATRTTQAIEDAGGLDKYTDKYLEQDLVTGQEYSSGSEVLDWAFADDTEEGSVYVRENSATNAPYGYYLARKPYRDETVTIDVRHILFLLQSSGGSYETIEQAHSEAERIHQQWISEGQTVEGFISLCAQYSEDGNAGSGGLYTDVPPGKMVQPFNDWCFDESRKVGDHGVVDTQYGAHIMYFEGRYIAWSRGAEQALSDTLYDEVYAAQESRTPVSFHDDVLSSINW